MKKIISAVALTLCIAFSCCFAVACGENNNIDNEKKFAELERLIEDLKNQIGELEENKNSNVFWTEKQEYSQNETMTIYYGNSAVLKLKVRETFPYILADGRYIIGWFDITSLLTDIDMNLIAKTTYVEYDGKIAYNANRYLETNMCQKGVENDIGANYPCTGLTEVLNAKEVKIVVCVPGTPFPLAHFKISKINIKQN